MTLEIVPPGSARGVVAHDNNRLAGELVKKGIQYQSNRLHLQDFDVEKSFLLRPHTRCCQVQKMGPPSLTERDLCTKEERKGESAEEHRQPTSPLRATSEHTPRIPGSERLEEKDCLASATRNPSDATEAGASETNPKEQQSTPATPCGPAAATTFVLEETEAERNCPLTRESDPQESLTGRPFPG